MSPMALIMKNHPHWATKFSKQKIANLVGDFNPFEKYLKNMLVKMGIFPNFRGENKIFETTT